MAILLGTAGPARGDLPKFRFNVVSFGEKNDEAAGVWDASVAPKGEPKDGQEGIERVAAQTRQKEENEVDGGRSDRAHAGKNTNRSTRGRMKVGFHRNRVSRKRQRHSYL